MWRRRFFFILAVFGMGSGAPDRLFAAVPSHIAIPFCRAEISRFLNKKGVDSRWRPVAAAKSTKAFRARGPRFGVWYDLRFSETEILAREVADTRLKTFKWRPGECGRPASFESEFDVVAGAVGRQKRFESKDLSEVVRSNAAGLIVSWSPSQIHSFRALGEFESVAKELNLPVLFLASSHFGPDAIQRVAQKFGRSLSDRRIASVELAMRDMNLQTPSVLVYGFGRLAEEPIVGRRDRRTLRNLILLKLRELAR